MNHVLTGENCADCESRGLLPSEQISLQIWFTGPHLLSTNIILPSGKFRLNEGAVKGNRKTQHVQFRKFNKNS